MTEEQEKQDSAAENPDEDVLEPQSKYERIMIAAAEAARLNEEYRRKGVKADSKLASEAIRRVQEGKVRAVIGHLAEPLEPMPESPSSPSVADPLFSAPLSGARPTDAEPPESGEDDED